MRRATGRGLRPGSSTTIRSARERLRAEEAAWFVAIDGDEKVGMVFGELINGEVNLRIWIHPRTANQGLRHLGVAQVALGDGGLFPHCTPGGPRTRRPLIRAARGERRDLVVVLTAAILAVPAVVGVVVFGVIGAGIAPRWSRLPPRSRPSRCCVRGEKGVYRGATAPGYPAVRNNGRIALTRRRLVFVTSPASRSPFRSEQITGVGQAKVFRAGRRGWTHLVVHTATGDIGFFVPDLDAWLAALGQATGSAAMSVRAGIVVTGTGC